jgi:valyl-tRNA synthetase
VSERAGLVNEALEEFRMSDATSAVYTLVWNEVCDWYIEFSKELLADPKTRAETQLCLCYVIQQSLLLAHPLIPFVTEEIYSYLPAEAQIGPHLMLGQYPVSYRFKDLEAVRTVESWKDGVERFRAFRGENNISPKARPSVTYAWVGSDRDRELFESVGVKLVASLAQLGGLSAATTGGMETGKPEETGTPDETGQIVSQAMTFSVPLRGLVDFAEELKRLQKQVAQLNGDMEHISRKLDRPDFLAKAPPELVVQEREKLKKLELDKQAVEVSIARVKRLV